MEQWIKAKGRLVYEWQPELKKQHKTKSLVIMLSRDGLDLYYQWFLKQFGSWKDRTFSDKYGHLTRAEFIPVEINRPMFGTHVTIIKGDEPQPKSDAWKKYANEKIEFEYSPNIEQHWRFLSLPVRDSTGMLQKLRDEMGCTRRHNFHLTIGRISENEPLMRIPE